MVIDDYPEEEKSNTVAMLQCGDKCKKLDNKPSMLRYDNLDDTFSYWILWFPILVSCSRGIYMSNHSSNWLKRLVLLLVIMLAVILAMNQPNVVLASYLPTQTITLHYLIDVNCYLVKTGDSYILIDTGFSTRRTDFEKELESAGVRPGNLKLIVLTHGDFDHTGNAAYLRKKFGTEIAMHDGDSGMVERGDMFWNRIKGNILLGMMVPILFGFGKSERFKPDLYIEDGYNLSGYGFDAKVLHIPGHSKGSIGILKSLKINTVYPGHGKPFPMDILIKNNTLGEN